MRHSNVVGLILALLVAACAPSQQPAAQAPGRQPDKFVADVTIAIDKWSESLLPGIENDFEHLSPLYDPLFKIEVSEKDGQVLKPAFVREWEVRDGGKRFWMKVQQGVEAPGWGEVTAEDVVWMLNQHYQNFTGSFIAAQWKPIGVVAEQTGKYELEVSRKDGQVLPLSVIYHDIPRRANLVVVKKYVESVGVEEAKRKPIGTGAFTLVSSGGGRDVFQAKKEHWRIKPTVERLTFMHVPDSQVRAQMVLSGAAQLARRVETGHAVDATSRGAKPVVQPFDKTYYVNFGGLEREQSKWAKCPWNDLRVRQAMAYAIDRGTMFQQLKGGQGNLRNGLNSRTAEQVLPGYKYDVQLAKRLLAEAGYPNGFEFEMPMLTVSGAPRAGEEHTALLSYFSAIGLRPKSAPTDFMAIWNNWLNRELDCKVFVWSTPTQPWLPATGWEKFNPDLKTSGAFVDDRSTQLSRDILKAATGVDKNFETLEAQGYKYLYDVVAIIPLYTGAMWNLAQPSFVDWDWQGHDDTTRYDAIRFGA